MRLCACVWVFFWLAGVGVEGLWVQRRFEAGLRVTDIVKNEGSEMCLRWRGAENLKKKKIIFFCPFSQSFYLKKCDFKRSHGAVSALCVSPHTRHRLSILFLYEKKKKRYYTRQS